MEILTLFTGQILPFYIHKMEPLEPKLTKTRTLDKWYQLMLRKVEPKSEENRKQKKDPKLTTDGLLFTFNKLITMMGRDGNFIPGTELRESLMPLLITKMMSTNKTASFSVEEAKLICDFFLSRLVERTVPASLIEFIPAKELKIKCPNDFFNSIDTNAQRENQDEEDDPFGVRVNRRQDSNN